MSDNQALHLDIIAVAVRRKRQKSNKIAAFAHDFWINVVPTLAAQGPPIIATPITSPPLAISEPSKAHANSIALALLLDRARLNKTIPHYSEVEPMTFSYVLEEIRERNNAGKDTLEPIAPCMRSAHIIHSFSKPENSALFGELLEILADAENPGQWFDSNGYPLGILQEHDERRVDRKDIDYIFGLGLEG